ncbi:DoxX family protein [Amycolatopsis cihanbeyliensis]|uniref:Putative membrane protein YphA (DoxX/SURF4 family) n=1 Tax=Amycolatopsis cihanbeyliensis TaxID=1128664 RepID=A0A542DLC6_AMYCI|nr:DoxX family protein [Amycolatopsis cihanbeyliensis]TQJ03745.1 putative membrane protein YphA (DoxX/SURF4 family) [Amycolatopsis cihanbeyliensis]
MILRRVARPLLAAIFISGGINALRDAEGHAKAAEPLLDRTVGTETVDAATLVRADAAVKVGAGTALALGRFPRFAAALLLGSLVPTTAAGHPFWEKEDPGERQQQLVHFLKNAGMAGGLLLAVADTGGRPSVGWRARRAARRAGAQAGALADKVR